MRAFSNFMPVFGDVMDVCDVKEVVDVCDVKDVCDAKDVCDIKEDVDVCDVKDFVDVMDVSNATMSWSSAIASMRRCLAWSCLMLQ